MGGGDWKVSGYRGLIGRTEDLRPGAWMLDVGRTGMDWRR